MISDALKESLSDWEVIEFIDNSLCKLPSRALTLLAWNDSMHLNYNE